MISLIKEIMVVYGINVSLLGVTMLKKMQMLKWLAERKEWVFSLDTLHPLHYEKTDE